MGFGEWLDRGGDFAFDVFTLGQGDKITGVTAAEKQEAAAQQASADAQAALAQSAMLATRDIERYGDTAAGILQQYPDLAAQYIQGGFGEGMGYLGAAQSAGDQALVGGGQYAIDQFQGGANAAQDFIGAAGDQAAGAYGSGFGQQRDALTGITTDRLGGMLDAGLYSGFEADPGYQFRKEQGEKALAQKFAASGGRYGGDALKAAMEFNQGLASQEFGNYAARQQAAAGIAGSSDAQRNQLAGQVGQSYGAEGASMADLYSRTGSQMADYGMQGAQLAGQAGMQTGQGLAQSQGMYGSQLADMSVQQGASLGNLQQQSALNLANLYSGMGSNMANAYTGNAAAAANAIMAPVQYAGGGDAALSNFAMNVGGAALGGALAGG